MNLEPHQRWLAISLLIAAAMTVVMLWGLGREPLTAAEQQLVRLETDGWAAAVGEEPNPTAGLFFLVYTTSWLRIVPDDALLIRLSILPFNLLALLLMIKISHLLLGARGGTLALVLLALSPTFLTAARHLGPETFTMVLSLLVLQNGWMMAEEPDPRRRTRWLVPFVLCAGMLIYTDLLGMLVVATALVWGYRAATRDGRNDLRVLITRLAVVIAFASILAIVRAFGDWSPVSARLLLKAPADVLMGPGGDWSRPLLTGSVLVTGVALLARGCWILWKVGSLGAPMAHFILLALALGVGLGWPLLALMGGGSGLPAARLTGIALPLLMLVCTAGVMASPRHWRVIAAFTGGVPLLVSWMAA